MNISTMVGNQFSILFIIFNFIAFSLCKMTVLSNIKRFGFVEILLIIVIAAIVSGIYSLIYIKLLKFLERYIVHANGHYDKSVECNVFYEYDENYIFLSKQNDYEVYVNSDIALSIYLQYDTDGYMEELKSRIRNLNRKDKLYINIYKYVPSMLLSTGCFFLWQICRSMNFANSFSDNFFILLKLVIIESIIISIYYILIELFLFKMRKIMEKRDLDFLMYE